MIWSLLTGLFFGVTITLSIIHYQICRLKAKIKAYRQREMAYSAILEDIIWKLNQDGPSD